ncbi:TPA: hypothetical protein TUD23_000823 [Streptococcus equi subsp. zooepidemicus]|uniref:hypothetical protein n=1 Tax=Streptococcus equi TaxID=1336 RepID=UPI001E4B2B15|nr:hypothetical protein [Streptococcus equi]MCD3372298.1 hypothetical protein [Streptococcus equi subsp. zooepidemicus]HEL0067262.1 hypothetical protein [Streptococcus equi subsp. zooepidemicus]HEL0075510.1 hypothetical protein [Streptococcus equi subsp. zooepidemicus]HEL0089542.1 hypothetical protein [Streptococcus equi subsp. zooepidemicus]HEL0218400.1 hypothetical protein [Streptococcus equi subsp. zooepidemicus]
MTTITLKTFAFYAINNDSCYTLLDDLLSNNNDKLNDEQILKSHNVLDKIMDSLTKDGYQLSFTKNTIICFEKQILVELSVEYRATKLAELFGWERQNLANYLSNRARAGYQLQPGRL